MLKSENTWQSRTELLIGEEAVRRLAASHVLVVGLGGVGGIAAELLVRAGVGAMTIADGDIVEPSNRNRQLCATIDTAGQTKASVLAARFRSINPNLRLTVMEEYLTPEKMRELLTNHSYSCTLDAIDTIAPKLELIAACVETKTPLVSCMGSGARLDPEQVRTADISKTEYCPLAKAIRCGLRKMGITTGVTAVFSPEPPVKSAVLELEKGEERNKRSTTGTISYMPAVFGCHCAHAVLAKLTGGFRP